MAKPKKIEFGPVVRALTKKMDHSHARERQVAWTCAAWAFRRVDDSLEGYAVMKGQLDMLYDRQMEAREALVRDIEEWRAFDAALEPVLLCFGNNDVHAKDLDGEIPGSRALAKTAQCHR